MKPRTIVREMLEAVKADSQRRIESGAFPCIVMTGSEKDPKVTIDLFPSSETDSVSTFVRFLKMFKPVLETKDKDNNVKSIDIRAANNGGKVVKYSIDIPSYLLRDSRRQKARKQDGQAEVPPVKAGGVSKPAKKSKAAKSLAAKVLKKKAESKKEEIDALLREDSSTPASSQEEQE